VLIVLAAVIVAAAVLKAATDIAAAIRGGREDTVRQRAAHLLASFAAGVAAAEQDPRALLAWEPLARTARKAFPDEFRVLDDARGAMFPFGAERLKAAHAAWTAEWLAWERSHDLTYKLKAVVAEHELEQAGGSTVGRATLEAIEREKLDTYQRRYEEYIRVAKALQALAG
jgi:hypothetical protein